MAVFHHQPEAGRIPVQVSRCKSLVGHVYQDVEGALLGRKGRKGEGQRGKVREEGKR